MKYEFTDEEVEAIHTINRYCDRQKSCETCVFYNDSARHGILSKFCHNILPKIKYINTVVVEEYKNIYERSDN